MVGEVSFAVLAAKDLVRVQIDVVCEPHARCLSHSLFMRFGGGGGGGGRGGHGKERARG